MFKYLFSLLITPVALGLIASTTSARPDSHAPLTVMGDHTHRQGEWMTSYRFMTMSMGPNYAGSSQITPAEVHADFMIAPLSMDMDMHMLGIMYAPSDKITLMGMLNYTETRMDHLVRNGVTFTTRSSGVGDTGIAALWSLVESQTHRAHLNLGLSLPTGDIDVRDATPMGPNTILPYPMRLGLGTYDLKPGITWSFLADGWSMGAQAITTLRLSDNDRDYTLGDRFDTTAWISFLLHESVSVSGRISYAHWGDIEGADSRLNPMMVPTARTDLRGGSETTAWIGLNWEIPTGTFAGHRLALEYGKVVDRDLDGPQLGTNDILTFGWQLAF
ncbi:MAG: transporter [Synoicihabitans sp.]